MGTYADFTVLSVTYSGNERWVYRYNGPGNYRDGAYSITKGLDSNLYASGYSRGVNYDWIVISLEPNGGQRWVYRYNGPGNSDDEAYKVIVLSDGKIGGAGYSTGIGTFSDFTVIKLNPVTGVEENLINRQPTTTFRITTSTIQNNTLAFELLTSRSVTLQLSLYNIQGEKIASWQVLAPKGISHFNKNLSRMNPGIYFLKTQTGIQYQESKKIIIAR